MTRVQAVILIALVIFGIRANGAGMIAMRFRGVKRQVRNGAYREGKAPRPGKRRQTVPPKKTGCLFLAFGSLHREELSQNHGTILGHDALGNFDAVIEAWIGAKVEQRSARSGLGVAGAEH